MRRLPLLALLAISACASEGAGAPEPADEPGPAPTPGAEDPAGLEPETLGLLERLLVEELEAADPVPDPDDQRPLCLDLGFQAGAGPFRIAGRELPPAAVEAAVSDGLRIACARDGPLAGPRAVDWPALFPPELEAVLAAPLPEEVCARGRALGAGYLIAGRVERLEHERVAVYLPLADRFEGRERGRVLLRYELYELERGALVCEGEVERQYDLDGLSPAALASAERLIAREAARRVVEELARWVDPGAAAPR